MASEHLDALLTEGPSPYTDLDARPVTEVLEILNREDQEVPRAVGREIPRIAQAVELAVGSLGAGGRLFYVGAGTSGRLGFLDAAECPPTFGVPPDRVQAVLAGGEAAMAQAVEDVEDDAAQGARDLKARGVGPADVVVGIAASGRTPYVLGALRAARRAGAATVALVSNPGSPMAELADVTICPVTGPEVLLGSTRLKAGTAQKLVLNMISTAAWIRLGKVYSNLMVDLSPSNAKLIDRRRRIVQLATGCTPAEAEAALAETGGRTKPAIVMLKTGCTAAEAASLLERSGGFVRQAMAAYGTREAPSPRPAR